MTKSSSASTATAARSAPDRIVLRLPPLRPYQRALVDHPARGLVVVSATQVGKTFACACWLLAEAWMRRGSLCWWAAPVYDQADRGYKLLCELAERAIWWKQDYKRRLCLRSGSVIECKSWEREENLQGPSVHALVRDEAGLLTLSARAILDSRLSATLGRTRDIGNPTHNKSEFFRLCRQAEEPANRERLAILRWTWVQYRDYLAAENHGAAALYEAAIEAQRQDLPDHEYRRLYEAEFTSAQEQTLDLRPVCLEGGDEAQPCRLPYSTEPDGERCVAGLDLAQREDYTVLVVLGLKTRRVRAIVRMRRAGYEAMIAACAECARTFGAPTWYDATGVGVGLSHEVQKQFSGNNGAGKPVHAIPVVFSNESKADLIQHLQLCVQRRDFTMPYVREAVLEADAFEAEPLPSGRWRYGAAQGDHDDIVIALALALHGARRVVVGDIR